MANRLTKIYTRTGDAGTTGKADGSRIAKDDVLITAIGDVDELNSMLAVVVCHADKAFAQQLNAIQHRLFDIGAELAMTGYDRDDVEIARLTQAHVDELEQAIDSFNSELPALKEFILPGGSEGASHCHVARAVCRRAERRLVSLDRQETLNGYTLAYINRLSDYLFVLARIINKRDGRDDVFWDNRKRSG